MAFIDEKILNPGPEDHHMHTSTFSDGTNSFDELVRYAGMFGLRTITITDHSDATLEAAGLAPNYRGFANRFLNPFNNVVVHWGVEGDLVNDEGDICTTIRGKESDFVILSVHNGGSYMGDPRKVTQGYVKAIEQHYKRIHLIGHPDGIYYAEHMDIETVVDAANTQSIPVELNGVGILQGTTVRDLTRRMLARADRIIVNSDAHMAGELRFARQAAFDFLREECYVSKAFYDSVTRQNKW